MHKQKYYNIKGIQTIHLQQRKTDTAILHQQKFLNIGDIFGWIHFTYLGRGYFGLDTFHLFRLKIFWVAYIWGTFGCIKRM